MFFTLASIVCICARSDGRGCQVSLTPFHLTDKVSISLRSAIFTRSSALLMIRHIKRNTRLEKPGNTAVS